MIVGLGMDLVDLERVRKSWERFGPRFAARILCAEELAALPGEPVAYLAARFAAKEAAVKALGTGFSNGIGPHDCRVLRQPSGQPEMIFSGAALERFKDLGAARSHLTLTHSRLCAGAVVILEG
ncbi:holo-[acyl-carrier-protein] synthase [Desulfovibrio sp. OttesenSCG-928-C14]|nr:holo-[acyl-carrier-protein] synthase [Desulfovibrio sp. OttesenSCG-928-C14]